MAPPALPRSIGRYTIFDEIAAGGMATVHLGRLVGPVGFSRTVAIKRLHPQFAKDPEFVSMFLDEARLAARIRHQNVVQTLDVVAAQGELFLVMEYVSGESLARLMKRAKDRDKSIPPAIAASIVAGALHGLHAAHEATDERGAALELVHRDFTPQNILVDVEGVARVLDFGVAKAAGRIQVTAEGQLKGKFAYMAPEQVHGRVSRRTDIFAAGAVLWETLTLRRLFLGDSEAHTMANVMTQEIVPPSTLSAGVPKALDEVVEKALRRDASDRFASAREMATTIERVAEIATQSQVREWLLDLIGDRLEERSIRVREIESSETPVAVAHDSQRMPSKAPTADGDRTVADKPLSESAGALQPSSASLVDAAPAPRRRSGVVLPAAALGLLLVGVGVGKLARSPGEPPSNPPAGNGSVQPGSPLGTLSATASAGLASATASAGSASATASAGSASATASASRPPSAPGPAATNASKPSKADCDPPYILDALGHKKWKPSCI